MGSQFTRSGNTKSVSMVRAVAPVCNSLTTCCKIGSRSTPASRESVRPPPRRPRAKSRTLSIRPDIRTTLPCIMSRICAPRLLKASLRRRLAPPAMEARGLRRSCPSTAMNCSRNADAFCSSRRFLIALSWKPITSANISNISMVSGVFNRCGSGSMAHNVPNMDPSVRRMGIEI